jgi:hypothetical protein
MDFILMIAGLALFMGFCLGVLVMRLLDLCDPDESSGQTGAHAHAGSAWWR